MRACIKSRTSSNFGQIGPLATELASLERLKISHRLIIGKWCLHASSFIFDRIIIKVGGNQDRHKSSAEFDFGPLVSLAHLYVFWNEIWPWHIGLRWAIVALWATCFAKPSMDFIQLWRDDRALSKILCSTIPIPVLDLKIKVTDFEFFCIKSLQWQLLQSLWLIWIVFGMNWYKILKCFRKEKRVSGELPCPAQMYARIY